MTDASATTPPVEVSDGDGISLRIWVGAYALLILGGAALMVAPVLAPPDPLEAWTSRPIETFRAMSPEAKLLGMGVYLALCCTFLPLPTGWIPAALAAREVAIFPGSLWATTLSIALVGAVASTIANLNEYHILTWMMRSRRIGKIRQARSYKAAVRWFHNAPLLAMLVFNILPIPIDVVRVLAATSRYPRLPFAAANFAGRFVRYGLIAGLTFWLDLGWAAPAALLAVGAALGLGRLILAGLRSLRNGQGPEND